ncbi:MAG TPA: DNA-3-methyladenine glycosylase I [Acidimicrobiales bacterium]
MSDGAPAAVTPIDVVVGADGRARCRWAASDPDYQLYHDEEWGTPLHGDHPLFEKMCLEGFQAGLSWITILRKRPAFRQVFYEFDPVRVAAMRDDDVDAAMGNAGIIRNRAKVLSTIKNAKLTLELIRDNPGALDELMWSFAPPERAQRLTSMAEVPAVTDESVALSKALRKLGFGFVGPTTMYALMQSTGMVDDHVTGCWRAN